MTDGAPSAARLLLILPTTTYRADAFVDAAKELGLDLTVASEVPSSFQQLHPTDLITLDLNDAKAATATVGAFAEQHPLAAVVGVDDGTAALAARIGGALGLPTNPASAMEAAGDKAVQRQVLLDRGVPVPGFALHTVSDDPLEMATATTYPCVLKPISMSASRGVVRANDADEFLAARARLVAILQSAAISDARFLVEQFVPGPEFALEGLVVDGALHVLGLFDKPDPLDGPFFEETIYVTPSRSNMSAQRPLVECAQTAVTALGLRRGPVHIELRHNAAGPWLIEAAARPIGGKCARVLRFGEQGEMSLESLILRQAVGRLRGVPRREVQAAGVMMIPIPRAGILREVSGLEAARSMAGVEEVLITTLPGQELVPLPEGSRYLGFIFARGETPALVESALRGAHEQLEIGIDASES